MTTGRRLKGVLVALTEKIDLDWAACERLAGEINWAKLKPLAADLVDAHSMIAADLDDAKGFIRRCIAEVRED